jgi:pilus assembly protein CpaB
MIVVLAIAVVTATLASTGIVLAVRRLPRVEVQVPATHVLVAARPLEAGMRITRDSVKLVPWPAGSPVARTFQKIEDAIDRGVVAIIAENEPVTEDKLAPIASGVGLPPVIKTGMRAVSLKVNEVIGVAGFVVPGTRVDVIVTMRQERDSVSRVVVSNVQVLTAGVRLDEAEAKKEGKPIPSNVVTLMLTPAEAERIALASQSGQIVLALRNPLDTDAVNTPGIRTAGLFGGAVPNNPGPRAPAPARPRKPMPESPAQPVVAQATVQPQRPPTVIVIKNRKVERQEIPQ